MAFLVTPEVRHTCIPAPVRPNFCVWRAGNAAAQTANTVRTTERAIVLIENVEATMSTPAHGLEYPSVVIFTLKNFGRIIAESVKLTGALTGVGNLPIKELPPTTIAPQG